MACHRLVAGHYSIAIFDISKVRGGSKLKFTQIGIPQSQANFAKRSSPMDIPKNAS
jgi:hypothetical protein